MRTSGLLKGSTYISKILHPLFPAGKPLNKPTDVYTRVPKEESLTLGLQLQDRVREITTQTVTPSAKPMSPAGTSFTSHLDMWSW